MNKNRLLWYLYDFANSIALVGLLYYFGIWIVTERGGSQWLVSLPVSLATLVLLIVMPRIARRVDQSGGHKSSMIWFSVCASLTLLALALFGMQLSIPLIFVLYLCFNIFFEAGYIFSSSLLHTVSEEHNRAQVSGIGQAWGQSGNLVGVILSFITVSHFMVAENDKLNIFFWSALVFLLLLIPITRFKVPKKDISQPESLSHQPDLQSEVLINSTLIKKLKSNKKATRFLCAYALYSDAVVTLTLFIALYFKKVLIWTDGQIRIASVLMLLSTLIGGILVSFVVKRGNELKMISRALILWPVTICILAFISTKVPVYIITVIIGFLMSFIFAVSRAYYSLIIPVNEQAEYFSIFVVFERIGAVIGPLLWSTIVSLCLLLDMSEVVAYKIAIISVALITGIGYFIIKGMHMHDEIEERGGKVIYH